MPSYAYSSKNYCHVMLHGGTKIEVREKAVYVSKCKIWRLRESDIWITDQKNMEVGLSAAVSTQAQDSLGLERRCWESSKEERDSHSIAEKGKTRSELKVRR